MQNDDEMKTLLRQWQVPEPRADLAARIVTSAMAEEPAPVVPVAKFDSWAARFRSHGWKAVAAALALALAVTFSLPKQPGKVESAILAQKMAEQQAESLLAEVSFEDDDDWSAESVYSYL